MKRYIGIFVIALFGAISGAAFFKWMSPTQEPVTQGLSQPVQFASFPDHILQHPNFVTASAIATPAVVHIKTKASPQSSNNQGRSGDPFRDFFGPEFFGPRGPQMGSGSGVILSEDGYIVTNNHVITNADEIEVVLNDKRSFNARVIGTDPSTDIALVKIETNDLPFLQFGNSDDLQVGEWVLAVGNPFNLTSTVTAGIVSAKGRNINILGGGSSIEAFIQTDAAVNPGNSGGALVTVQGELIGINTAIATNTGSYQGYSFAVPANIAGKVVEDLKNYGTVQRAFLGIQIQDVDAALASRESLSVTAGAFVADYLPNSAAEAAGLKKGDVIIQIDGVPVRSTPQLMEVVSRKRPGDEVSVVVNRKGKEQNFSVTLRNAEGSTGIVKTAPKTEITALLGAQFETASKKELESLQIDGGVKVVKLGKGKLQETGIREGFIITRVDRNPVKSPKDLISALKSANGGVLLEGFYPNGAKAYYGFGM
ncbi:MAG: Do family serine endopeptidase [Bacteroidia bacterium]